MKTIAVIPAYNESNNIRHVIEEVRHYVDCIVVVDDGSSDDTYEQARMVVQSVSDACDVIVLRHDINLGKGTTLKTGCKAAVQLDADSIICIDADNQHNPKSIPQFIQAIQDGRYDIVFGARAFDNNMPFTMFIGNRFLSVVVNKLFHIFLHDTQSGYRAFTREAFEKMNWESTGYEVETEMIIRASEQEFRYTEVDIDTIYHDDYKGTTALDGVKIFLHILKWKFI